MFTEIKDQSQNFRNLVDGKWIFSNSDDFIDIKSPIDNSLVGRVPAMTKEETDFIIDKAREAQLKWKNVELNDRTKILYNASRLLVENCDEITEIIIREIAKDKKSARAEVLRTADFISFTADIAKTLSGESSLGDSFPGYKRNKILISSRLPLGVVLAISPFNYPINLAASKIAPAIVMGNSVVFKPATQGSICGIYLASIFKEAGVPDGVLNTITGKGSVIGDYITTHKNINFINFTGSTEVGKRISNLAGMIPELMELGGKDAAIVLKDADLNNAVSNIVAGAYSYSGQRCTAIKRVLVEEDIADELVKGLKEQVLKLKIINPLKEEGEIVPLINNKSAEYVYELIMDAKDKGADIICGGQKKDNIIYPTLIDNVTEDMRVAWEEPFGPVLPIIRVKDKEEAIEIANKSEYGLQSSVFTENINSAFYVASKLEVGTVQINNKTERGPDNFPFTGVKSSGLGTQGIRYSIEAMTRLKGTVLNLK